MDQLIQATANRAIVSRRPRLTSSLSTRVLWKFDLEWDEGNKDDWSGRRVWLMHEKGPLLQDVLIGLSDITIMTGITLFR